MKSSEDVLHQFSKYNSGPKIVFVNPHCSVDEIVENKLSVMGIPHVSLMDVHQAIDLVEKSNIKQRMFVTTMKDIEEVKETVETIDRGKPVTYVILLGPLSDKVVTLADLLRGCEQ